MDETYSISIKTEPVTGQIDTGVNEAIIEQIRDLPRWTHEELGYLMQLCENGDRTWEKRVEVLDHLFGKDHEPGFFTIETCQEKYKRLNGESQGKPVDKELHKWMQEYLKNSLAETCGNSGLAKLVKARRHYEISKHVADGRFTADQMVELSGIGSTIDYLSEKVVEPENEDRAFWLNADLINSKISLDDWKSFRCINDVVRKIHEVRNTHVDESRLVFHHDSLEMQAIVEQEPIQVIKLTSPILPEIQEPEAVIKVEETSVMLPEVQEPKEIVVKAEENSIMLPKAQNSRKVIKESQSSSLSRTQSQSGSSKLIKSEPESPIVKKKKVAKQHDSDHQVQKTILTAVHTTVFSFSPDDFKEPVVFPGYTNIIKKPMDLKTIGKMIEKDKLTNLTELREMYLLMCTNAIIFNPEGHLINQEARELMDYCEKQIKLYSEKKSTRQSVKRASTSHPAGGTSRKIARHRT